jgi:hypothetical protein
MNIDAKLEFVCYRAMLQKMLLKKDEVEKRWENN